MEDRAARLISDDPDPSLTGRFLNGRTRGAEPAQLHHSGPSPVYRDEMPSVQVKDVPDQVHAVLRQRAAAAGQSLQEYLLALFSEHARHPTMDEVLNRIDLRSGGSLPLAAAALAQRVDRPRRS